MLVRIVKLRFRENEVSNFLAHFETVKNTIRNFPGCQFLELYRDQTEPTIFFTYSYWENVQALDNYRHSDIFKGIWAATKPKFAAKPEAWSVDKLASLE